MEELALHILDIAENSVRAGARNVEIRIEEDMDKDRLTIAIRDDGRGMDKRTQKHALDPFFTTKASKRVGLGLPLLAAAARRAGGDIAIRSKRGAGTEIEATFQHSHLDRQPLGNVAATLETLIMGNPDVDFRFIHVGRPPSRSGYCSKCKERSSPTVRESQSTLKELDTRDIRAALNGAPTNSIESMRMVRKILEDN